MDFILKLTMIFILILCLEVTLLLLMSKILINSLVKILYRLTGSHSTVINILVIIFLPGTILHELAHLLVAGVLLVPVGDLEVVPVISGDEVRLGSVQIGSTDPLRRTIIGIAPILVGIILIIFGLSFIQSIPNGGIFSLQNCLAFYLIFTVSSTMFSSKKDLEGTMVFSVTALILLGLSFLALNLLGLKPAELILRGIQLLDNPGVSETLKSFSRYLLVPLLVDLSVLILASLLKKILIRG